MTVQILAANVHCVSSLHVCKCKAEWQLPYVFNHTTNLLDAFAVLLGKVYNTKARESK